MSIPKTIICDECGNSFESQTSSTICTQCLLRPRMTREPTITKEEIVAQNCKDKKCVDCEKIFTPTSNVQKRCIDCIKAHKTAANAGKKTQAKPPAKAKTIVPVMGGGDSGMASFITSLIGAIGDQPVVFQMSGFTITVRKSQPKP